MQQSGFRLRIGVDLPPESATVFIPRGDDFDGGRYRGDLLGEAVSDRALRAMEIDRLPFARVDLESGQALYVVATNWDGQSKNRSENVNFADNWRSNLGVALEAAINAGSQPISAWVSVITWDEGQSAFGLLSDWRETLGLNGVSDLTLSLPPGASEMTQSLAEHATSLFPDIQIETVKEEDATLKSAASPEADVETMLIGRLQNELSARKLFEGIADGAMGPQTADAFRRFLDDGGDPLEIAAAAWPELDTTTAQSTLLRIFPSIPGATAERPQIAETAPYYPDDPARIDQLNRRSVAEALATIIQGVWTGAERQTGDRSFVVHLHGPWGSGKTSILYFLEDLLKDMPLPVEEPPDVHPRDKKKPWLVVHYNAWRMQDQGPPWWTLIDAVYRKASKDPASAHRWHLKRRHFLWRFQHGWLSSVTQLAITVAAILFVAFGPNEGGVADILKSVAGVAGAISAAFLLKGDGGLLNSEASKRFRELSEDPIGPLTRRFEGLIKDVGRPVAIFIDDLDRCDADYVVDLLTQIQTLFRKANVLYVVAGDRNWICSSYEQTYDAFSDKIAGPGHSLGHMFLEKIFQISVEVPEITDNQRQAFLGHLLRADEEAAPDDLKAAADAAEHDLANVKTEAEVIAKNDAFKGTPAEKAVYAAASLKVLHRPELARERQKHILLNYADHLEPNPRAMKRLLNAYGFRRGYDIQAAERSDQDALICWTILENRWPVMASYLSGKTVNDAERKALAKLKNDGEVMSILNQIDWDSLPIVKGAEARFADLTPAKDAA